MSVTITCKRDGTPGYEGDCYVFNVASIEVEDKVVYTAPPTIPFKVGDFVRVKENVNPKGYDLGPKGGTAGKVLEVTGNGCRVEFPEYTSGVFGNRHQRNYYIEGAISNEHLCNLCLIEG